LSGNSRRARHYKWTAQLFHYPLQQARHLICKRFG
jgi:hypothetical protein